MAFFGSDWKSEDDYEFSMFKHWANKPENIGPVYYENFKPEPEHPKSWVVDRGDYQPISIKAYLDSLTDEERLEVFSHYCKHCGTKDKPCYCTYDD